MTEQYAVVGNPIAHSKSPLIHGLFAEQTAQDMEYSKIEAPLDGFSDLVKIFFSEARNKGLNVTVPFKEQAWQLCEERSTRAHRAGAVNTLYLNKQGQLCGDNTDGLGLVADIKDHGVSLAHKKILVLGAGGAVRGVLQPILEERPSCVVIANRTQSKADVLVDLFTELGNVSSSSYESLDGQYDLIINGTSASLSGELPPLPDGIVGSETVAYDMMYAQQLTVFNQWALTTGAKQAIDGLGMLVGQAAEAFAIWRGIRPETSGVMTHIRGL